MGIFSILHENNKPEKPNRRTSEIEFSQFVEVLKNDCSDIAQLFIETVKSKDMYSLRTNFLVRGIPSEGEYAIVDPSLTTRKRKTIHNIIVDSTWQGYPKREKSIFCTIGKQKTEPVHKFIDGFNRAYIVLPFNGALLCECPEEDFIMSFQPAFQDIGIEIGTSHIFDYSRYRFSTLIPEDLDELLVSIHSQLIKLNDMHKTLSGYTKLLSYVKPGGKYREYPEFKKAIINAMNPVNSGFKLSSYSQLDRSFYHEVWTESKCLIIALDAISDLQTSFLGADT